MTKEIESTFIFEDDYRKITIKKEPEYIGECKGNNDNGCFLDSCGHDCGCFVKNPKFNLERFKSLVTDTDTEIFEEAKYRVDNHERLKAEKKELFNRLVELEKASKEYVKDIPYTGKVWEPTEKEEEKIKEDAEKYAEEENSCYTNDFNGFIAGAKSESAKNYWFTIFKIEQNK